MHELEHHVAEAGLAERAAVARVDLFRSQELDAALLERRNRGRYVRRSKTDALQVFFQKGVARGSVGLDQLKHEAATGALEQQSHGHDAETHAIRQRRETEDLRVELDPVRGTVSADVLDDTEVVQAADGRGVRLDRRYGA